MNPQSKTVCKNVISKRETENCLLLYLLRRISNFPICLPTCPRWGFGNMEMPEDSIDYIRPGTHLKLICMTRFFLNLRMSIDNALMTRTGDFQPIHVIYFSLFSISFFLFGLKCLAMPPLHIWLPAPLLLPQLYF